VLGDAFGAAIVHHYSRDYLPPEERDELLEGSELKESGQNLLLDSKSKDLEAANGGYLPVVNPA
jgi:hypothetical protein